MMMAVYGDVAVVGQAARSPSDKMAMIIGVFMVVLVPRLHSTTLVNEEAQSTYKILDHPS